LKWHTTGRAAGTHRYPALLALFTVLLSACASTGSTWRSGVGDTFLGEPPYYAGTAGSGGVVAHLPVSYQRGAAQAPMFEPSDAADAPVAALLADMNAYLDGLGVSTRVQAQPRGTAPDVLFSCERMTGDECDDADDRRPMRLAVARPSREWADWAAGAAAAVGADRVLVITLEIGNYMPRQRNLLGSKEVRLGTGHTVGVPWLTALDEPVSVLQITGALVDREGRALRIGAEGILARRTSILLSAVGAQRLISDEDVEQLRSARRQELPGSPLVWQAALDTLVRELVR
jgi:hypothetical protein